MTAQLNHTIVYSSDPTESAHFLAEILGRPAPVRFGPFQVVELDNGVSLDFASADGARARSTETTADVESTSLIPTATIWK